MFNKLYSDNNKEVLNTLHELIDLSTNSDEIYIYLDEFFKMLEDDNPNIRQRAVILICKNAKWDKENKINQNLDKILDLTEDDEVYTARQCIKSLRDIINFKPELTPIILNKLKYVNYEKYNNMAILIKRDIDEFTDYVNSKHL